MKVTADTITDEQIRELHNADGAITFDWFYRAVHRERLVGESKVAFERSRRYYRARCAEEWNARHGNDEPTQHGPCDDCENFADLDENCLCLPCAERREKRARGGS